VNETTERPSEKELYTQVWKHEAYREIAPGEKAVQQFLQQATPRADSEVIDFGAGTGRPALLIAVLGGLKITMLDFAANCLDDEVRATVEINPDRFRFVEMDLCSLRDPESPVITAPYGFCTDVMEHIPPTQVDRVLNNILLSARYVYFQICTVPDQGGELVGHPLHLSVHDYDWWLQKFKDRDCMILFSECAKEWSTFYVSGWAPAPEIVKVGVVNEEFEQLRVNVKANCSRRPQWQQVKPYDVNPTEFMLLGGGPTLEQFTEQIRALRKDGVKLATLNGTYNWALRNGMMPSAQFIVDARPFNKRFVQPVIPDCKYMIASQCHPSVFEDLPYERTYMWHTGVEHFKDLFNEYIDGTWYPVYGGSTVLLRAIPLLRMLGYRKFHLFGCDSCLLYPSIKIDGQVVWLNGSPRIHHAYEQKENDDQIVVPVNIGDKIFHCHTWMISQAQEFIELIRGIGDHIELEIYGDGLLRYILETGAKLEVEKEFFR